MPDLLAGIDRIDDLHGARAPVAAGRGVPVEHGDAVQRGSVGGIRGQDAARRHPGKARHRSDRHRAFRLRRLSDATSPCAIAPLLNFWGKPANDRHARLLDHAESGGAADEAEIGRMPGHGLSEPGRPGANCEAIPRSSFTSRRASTSAISRSTPCASPSTTCACAAPSTWRSTSSLSSMRSIRALASSRRIRFRRRSGPTIRTSRTTPSTAPARSASLPKPATRKASRRIPGTCR